MKSAARLTFLTPDERAPLPNGTLPAGSRAPVVVGVIDPHPANVVEVVVGSECGRELVLRAVPVRHLRFGEIQWFRTLLPGITDGNTLEYFVLLRRAGQTLARLPADGSTFRLSGVEVPPVSLPSQAREPQNFASPERPRWTTELSFFASLTADLRAEVIGETAEGYRINFYVLSGFVRGPMIDASVLPEGGDSINIRRDGTGAINIQITYQPTDGALILERAGGIFDAGATGYDDAVMGRWLQLGSPRLYATPTWATSHPSWRWLNRCQGFAFGRVVLDNAEVKLDRFRVQWDIYIPQIGDSTADG